LAFGAVTVGIEALTAGVLILLYHGGKPALVILPVGLCLG
jgi:hypothetical protein